MPVAAQIDDVAPRRVPERATEAAVLRAPRYRCGCCLTGSSFLRLLAAHDARQVGDWREPRALTDPLMWTCIAEAALSDTAPRLDGLTLSQPAQAAAAEVAAPAVVIGGSASTAQPGAERVLVNGRVFTADPANLWCEALAVDNGQIVAAGTRAEVERHVGPRTEVIDLEGRLVIPGFNDAHMHHTPDPKGVRLPFDPMDGAQKVLGLLREAVAAAPAGTWIYGVTGLALTADDHFTRDALDAVAPTHPVIFLGFTNHTNVVNTLAMQRLGIAEDAADPLGGHFGRVNGRLDGRIHEYASWAPQRVLAMMASVDEGVASLQGLAQECLGWGITTLQNMSWTPADRYVDMLKAADLPVKVRVIRFPPSGPEGRLLSEGRGLPKQVGPRITVRGTKWILDGTPVERGAALGRPYADLKSTQGALNFSAAEVHEMLRENLATQEPLLLHAIGRQALETVLQAVESFGKEVDWRATGLRIEHGDDISPDQIKRVSALGLIIVQNPCHFFFNDLYAARLGAGAAPLKSLVGANVQLGIGSDGPLNPFIGLLGAVVHPTHPAEACSLEQALIAYTHGGAVAEGLGEHKGRLRPGYAADLAVLSQDLFAVPPPQYPATRSVLTMVDGKVHRPA